MILNQIYMFRIIIGRIRMNKFILLIGLLIISPILYAEEQCKIEIDYTSNPNKVIIIVNNKHTELDRTTFIDLLQTGNLYKQYCE